MYAGSYDRCFILVHEPIEYQGPQPKIFRNIKSIFGMKVPSE